MRKGSLPFELYHSIGKLLFEAVYFSTKRKIFVFVDFVELLSCIWDINLFDDLKFMFVLL